MPSEREPIVRVWPSAMTGDSLTVELDNDYVFVNDTHAMVLVPDGWWSLVILKPGDVVITALPEEQLCCLDSLRRGERGSRETVREVRVA